MTSSAGHTWILFTSILLFFGHMQSLVSGLASLLSEHELQKHAKVARGGLTRPLLDSWTGISIAIFSRFVMVPRPLAPARAQSRSQRPRSFWLATAIATSGQVQLQKSAIHGLPVTLRMLRAKSDKSDWFWSRSIVFTKAFKTRMSLDLARCPDFSSACQKGPLGTRLARAASHEISHMRTRYSALSLVHLSSLELMRMEAFY